MSGAFSPDINLVPTIGVLGKAGTLYSYDAEALAARRLHHHPTFQSRRHCRPKLLQARHFRRDVVGLDIDVHAAFVFHALDLHDGLIRRYLQHAVVAAAAGMIGIYRATQCLAPELSSFIHVGGLAVDQQRAESGMVHIEWPTWQSRYLNIPGLVVFPAQTRTPVPED
jgi:hypothetical protein